VTGIPNRQPALAEFDRIGALDFRLGFRASRAHRTPLITCWRSVLALRACKRPIRTLHMSPLTGKARREWLAHQRLLEKRGCCFHQDGFIASAASTGVTIVKQSWAAGLSVQFLKMGAGSMTLFVDMGPMPSVWGRRDRPRAPSSWGLPKSGLRDGEGTYPMGNIRLYFSSRGWAFSLI
jgi:hypothetical protein